MGRPRSIDPGLDRGVPKPTKKRRLSDGAGVVRNGPTAAAAAAAAAATHKSGAGPQRGGAEPTCPVVITRALARAAEAQQRTLCVLLSDAPDAALAGLLRGWKGAGGKGKCCVVEEAEATGTDRYLLLRQQQPQLRTIPTNVLAATAPGPDAAASTALGPKLGCAIVSDPLEQLTPRTLAALAQALHGGGMLVLVLPAAAAWEEVVPSSQSPLALLLGRTLARLPQCKGGLLVLDDQLNALQPLSTALRASGSSTSSGEGEEDDMSLEELRASLSESPVVGDLVKLAKTADQARVLLSFFEPASERSLAGTVSVTGPPGRGKSAAVGLCLAGAVAYGYSNIFLTAASLRTAQSIFRFLLKGFDALGYAEGKDYELIQATAEDSSEGQLLLRVNLFREHRQTVQFLYPEDAARLDESQAEVLAIDDAASLDPELARHLLGPYLLLVASTVGGAGGAGPSAAATLAERLRTQASTSASQAAAAAAAEVRGSQTKKGERRVHEERWRKAAEAVSALGSTRAFVPVAVEAPIHWSPRDPLERWVSRTLGLGAGQRDGAGGAASAAALRFGTPAPWDCELYRLNRRTLLSGHGVTELLLERLLAVYGAWDRRRDPDALLRLAEPDHHLLALLGPDAEAQGEQEGMPDILAVVHVRLARRAVMPEEQGEAPTVVAEVVHVATHSDVLRMGYGSRALRLLARYLRGEIGGAGHLDRQEEEDETEGEEEPTPVNEAPRPRQTLPPVLVPLEEAGSLLLSSSAPAAALRLEERVPRVACVENVPTAPAWSLRFWGKAGFRPVAMQDETQGQEEQRGAQGPRATVRMALSLVDEDAALRARVLDFQTRTLRLLPSLHARLGVYTALGLVERPEEQQQQQPLPRQQEAGDDGDEEGRAEGQEEAKDGRGDGAGPSLSLSLSAAEQAFLFTGHDLRRLEMYARSLVDHSMVADLLPLLGQLFFQGRLPGATRLPALQQAVLLGLGMQRKPLGALAREVQLPPHQVLALFNKAVRRLSGALQAIQEAEVEREMEASRRLTIAAAGAKVSLARAPEEGGQASLPVRLEEEMEAGAKESLVEMRRRQEEALRSLDLMQYAVKGSTEEWEEVLRASKGALAAHGMVQIRSLKQIADPATATYGLPPGPGEEEGDRRLGRKARKGRMEGAIFDVDDDAGGRKRGAKKQKQKQQQRRR